MKASKFSDAQKTFILKQGNDRLPVADQAGGGKRPDLRLFSRSLRRATRLPVCL